MHLTLRSRHAGHAVEKALLIAAMIVGSLALWIANPLLWLWIGANLQSDTQPSMGPYVLMLAGIVLTAVAIARGLQRLNRIYAGIDDSDAVVHVHLAWMRMRGGEHENRVVPLTVLEIVMIGSVIVAALLFLAWWIIVQPTPPGIEPGPSKD